jgi:hypothetical protein
MFNERRLQRLQEILGRVGGARRLEKGVKKTEAPYIEIIQRYSSPPVCIGRSFNAISSFPPS